MRPVMPNLPWSFDFESSPVGKPPLTWLNAGGKFAVMELPDKNKVLVKTLNLDLYHAARTFFGDTHRADYTIEADVQVGLEDDRHAEHARCGRHREQIRPDARGQPPDADINSWSGALPKEGQAGAALRLDPYNWEPDKWYHLKLSVQDDDKGPRSAARSGRRAKTNRRSGRWTWRTPSPTWRAAPGSSANRSSRRSRARSITTTSW